MYNQQKERTTDSQLSQMIETVACMRCDVDFAAEVVRWHQWIEVVLFQRSTLTSTQMSRADFEGKLSSTSFNDFSSSFNSQQLTFHHCPSAQVRAHHWYQIHLYVAGIYI